jgi:GNAT superfamily N-acetyltransferase
MRAARALDARGAARARRARARTPPRASLARWLGLARDDGAARARRRHREALALVECRALTEAELRARAVVDAMAACEDARASTWDARAIERAIAAPEAQRTFAGAFARESGALVGYAACASDGAFVATVERVCVREEWRGRGVGGAIVRALGETLREREIYDVGVRAPRRLVGFFEALNYDEDESTHMIFARESEEGVV